MKKMSLKFIWALGHLILILGKGFNLKRIMTIECDNSGGNSFTKEKIILFNITGLFDLS